MFLLFLSWVSKCFTTQIKNVNFMVIFVKKNNNFLTLLKFLLLLLFLLLLCFGNPFSHVSYHSCKKMVCRFLHEAGSISTNIITTKNATISMNKV